jgi:uncharacterized membrane protein
VKGLLGDSYRIEDAAKLWPGCEVTVVPFAVGQSGPTVTGYPALWKDLRKHDVIIFANASFDALGPEQRYQLREYVRTAGGGLLVLGGKSTYGNGGVVGSFLEPVLPGRPKDTRFDLLPTTGLLARTSATAVGNPKWPPDLTCPYAHQTTTASGAAVSLKVGATPVLSSAAVGKGRVACFTGAPYGEASPGKTPFFAWKDWPLLMRNVLRWLAGKEKE